MLSALYGFGQLDRETGTSLWIYWNEAMAISARVGSCRHSNTARTHLSGTTASGTFFANLGGFLLGLIAGFQKFSLDRPDPQEWFKGQVVLPAGWRSIEIDRLRIRGKPWRLFGYRRGISSKARAPLSS